MGTDVGGVGRNPLVRKKKYSGMLKWESYDRNREKLSFDDDNNPFPAPCREFFRQNSIDIVASFVSNLQG